MKSIQEIIEIVSKETYVPVCDIVNPSRRGPIVLARHLSMWACRWNTRSSMQMIAAAHGKRNHGTVINACTSIDDQASYNPSLKNLCEKILNQIK